MSSFISRTFVTTVRPYERLVMYTLGKNSGERGPGINFYLPGIQTYTRVNTQTITRNIKDMTIPSKDGASIMVQGSVEYHVVNATKYVNNVSNGDSSLLNRCQRALRSEVSSMTINEILESKNKINLSLADQLKSVEEEWGIYVTQIQVTDFSFDDKIKDAMATVARAEQTAKAKRMIAEADAQVAEILRKSSSIYDDPITLELRRMGMLERLGDKGNTMIVVPLNVTSFNSTALASALAKKTTTVKCPVMDEDSVD